MPTSCDRAVSAGRRDLAMLTLMARMGRRAGEVARLRLDDFGWRAAETAITGKVNRRDRLPLPTLARPWPGTCETAALPRR